MLTSWNRSNMLVIFMLSYCCLGARVILLVGILAGGITAAQHPASKRLYIQHLDTF